MLSYRQFAEKRLISAWFAAGYDTGTENQRDKVPLRLIVDRELRSSRESESEDLAGLVQSLSSHGQLQPICLRRLASSDEKYEVIFGSRRLAAARKLGWREISARIVESNDAESLVMALIENEDRKDFSDYERALVLEKIHSITGKTYAEVAQLIEKSPAFVSHHIAMLHLFPDTVASSDERKRVLCSLTEGHARALLKIEDAKERWVSAKFAIKANLGVRELEKHSQQIAKRREKCEENTEYSQVESMVSEIIAGLNRKDLTPLYGARLKHGFSLFSRFPPFDKLRDQDANDHIFRVLSQVNPFKIRLKDLDFISQNDITIAIMSLQYEIGINGALHSTTTRATLVFIRKKGNWSIVHEHWSGESDYVSRVIRQEKKILMESR